MQPTDFPGSNMNLVKPENMTDEECGSLPAEQGILDDVYPYFKTAWMPSQSEIEAINSGKPIFIRILSTSFPPMSVFTDE